MAVKHNQKNLHHHALPIVIFAIGILLVGALVASYVVGGKQGFNNYITDAFGKHLLTVQKSKDTAGYRITKSGAPIPDTSDQAGDTVSQSLTR